MRCTLVISPPASRCARAPRKLRVGIGASASAGDGEEEAALAAAEGAAAAETVAPLRSPAYHLRRRCRHAFLAIGGLPGRCRACPTSSPAECALRWVTTCG